MMFAVWACVCVTILRISAVSSAPAAEDGEQGPGYTNADMNSHMEYLRGKRLNNNVYTVIPPCAAAAAAAANIPAARTPEAFTNFAPEARYYMPSALDFANSRYAENMFRMDDPYSDNREMMRYSDTNFMDQMSAGRLDWQRTAPASYGSSYTGNLNGHYTSPGYSGPAYGIFPNANPKPCNVPLLFTCSPSVVTGHMVRPESQVYGSPVSISSGIQGLSSHAEAYRGVDELNAQRINANQEQAMNVNLTPVNKVTAAHTNEKST